MTSARTGATAVMFEMDAPRRVPQRRGTVGTRNSWAPGEQTPYRVAPLCGPVSTGLAG